MISRRACVPGLTRGFFVFAGFLSEITLVCPGGPPRVFPDLVTVLLASELLSRMLLIPASEERFVDIFAMLVMSSARIDRPEP